MFLLILGSLLQTFSDADEARTNVENNLDFLHRKPNYTKYEIYYGFVIAS